MSTVSLVVPVFQTPFVFEKFSRSLVEAFPKCSNSVELIIVNDGSSRQTSILIEQLIKDVKNIGSQAQLIEHRSSIGCGQSLNKAISVSGGENIILLDSDLILQKGWSTALLESLSQKDPSTGTPCGMSASVLLYPQTNGIQHAGVRFGANWLRHWRLNAQYTDIEDAYSFPQLAPFALFAFNREVFDAVGGIDESYRNGYEDFDFQLRARQEGYRLCLSKSSPSYHWELRSGPGRENNRKANLGKFMARWGNQIVDDATPAIVSELRRHCQKEAVIFDLTLTSSASAPCLEILKSEIDFHDIHRIEGGITSENLDFTTSTFISKSNSLVLFVDNFVQVFDNWFFLDDLNRHAKSVKVIDLYGNSYELTALLASMWPGRKIR